MNVTFVFRIASWGTLVGESSVSSDGECAGSSFGMVSSCSQMLCRRTS